MLTRYCISRSTSSICGDNPSVWDQATFETRPPTHHVQSHQRSTHKWSWDVCVRDVIPLVAALARPTECRRLESLFETNTTPPALWHSRRRTRASRTLGDGATADAVDGSSSSVNPGTIQRRRASNLTTSRYSRSHFIPLTHVPPRLLRP